MKAMSEETLRTWWKERRQSADVDQLRRRILRAVESDRFEEPAPVDKTPLAIWFPRFGYALAGAAALAICLLGMRRFAGGSGMGPDDAVVAMAKVPPGELAAGARVFSETARLFEHRLRWIAESDGEIGMGIDSSEEGSVEDSTAFFVRVTVLERTACNDAWQKTWQTDVVARGQEWVEVATNGKGKRNLMLWVYPLDDGRLLVDTDMALNGVRKLSLRESTILSAGNPVVLVSGRRGGIEYRVVQCIEEFSLPGEMG